MGELHKCVLGWAYCDGNCTTCAASNFYTTNGTITPLHTVKDYPPYTDYPKESKKQTNADHIRQMSDEEMADYLAERSTAPSCTGRCHKDYAVYGELRTFCQDCWLDWLKQEASDD